MDALHGGAFSQEGASSQAVPRSPSAHQESFTGRHHKAGVHSVSEPFRPCHVERKYTPHWEICEGTTFDDDNACSEFMRRGIPPGERQVKREMPRREVSTGATSHLVNAMVYVNEMIRDWTEMNAERRVTRELREGMIAERKAHEDQVKHLKWDLATAREETRAAEGAHKQAADDWRVACERDNAQRAKLTDQNRALEARVKQLEEENVAKTEIIALHSREASDLRLRLEQVERERDDSVKGQVAAQEETRWVLRNVGPELVALVHGGPTLMGAMARVSVASEKVGKVAGFEAGYALASAGQPKEKFPLQLADCKAEYKKEVDAFENLEFPEVGEVLSHVEDPDLSWFKEMFEPLDGMGNPIGDAGAGTSTIHEEEAEEEEEQVDYD